MIFTYSGFRGKVSDFIDDTDIIVWVIGGLIAFLMALLIVAAICTPSAKEQRAAFMAECATHQFTESQCAFMAAAAAKAADAQDVANMSAGVALGLAAASLSRGR